MRTLNLRTAAYWLTTTIVVLAFLAGAAFDLSGAPDVLASLDRLGYPAYLATLLGFWKALGALALIVPRLERFKEWAYAGMFFNLSGAAVSHLAAGDPLGLALPPLVILGFVMTSRALRPGSVRRAKAPGATLEESASRALATS